jgi:hypothetical protein
MNSLRLSLYRGSIPQVVGEGKELKELRELREFEGTEGGEGGEAQFIRRGWIAGAIYPPAGEGEELRELGKLREFEKEGKPNSLGAAEGIARAIYSPAGLSRNCRMVSASSRDEPLGSGA